MKLITIAATVAVTAVTALVIAAPASAWAPAAGAPIHPGVQTDTAGGQCTANFIFTDATSTYIGQAAHCSSTGQATETDGCTSQSLPLGTPVTVDGASRPGVLAYNSWLAMQAAGESDPDTCAYNDLALVRLDPADVASVNPSIPFWGGPTGLDSGGTRAGDRVVSYGNSSLRQGITQLSPKEGASLGDDGGGWSHTVYTVTPGIPGDSGSAFLDGSGRALGVLSTVAIAPLAASNGVGDVAREIAWANAHGQSISLVSGTEPFRGPILPIGS
ncbi:MAG: hypothetical protein JWP17_3083 [Solirubrobacterales bacterium]|nr:hypothetical protein [Solirubrobacterales bacterium]